MTLEDWLTEKKMTNAEFARVSGIGQRALVQKYRRGHMLPSIENVERIRKATGGSVTANDFVAQRVAALGPSEPQETPSSSAEAA